MLLCGRSSTALHYDHSTFDSYLVASCGSDVGRLGVSCNPPPPPPPFYVPYPSARPLDSSTSETGSRPHAVTGELYGGYNVDYSDG